MAPHSSALAWKIPGTGELGRLQSMGSLRVGHDSVISLSLFTFMHWRRRWRPTPVFLPGESQGRRSLVGCCLWGRTESDTTEATQQQHAFTLQNCVEIDLRSYAASFLHSIFFLFAEQCSKDIQCLYLQSDKCLWCFPLFTKTYKTFE